MIFYFIKYRYYNNASFLLYIFNFIFTYDFTILVENKRKIDDSVENPTAKTKRLETKLKCSDLVVLNIPYTYDEQKLKEYFGQFGELLMLQVIIKS